MSKEIMRRTATAVATAEEVTNGPEGLPLIQSQLLEWSREKQAETRADLDELIAARDKAKASKWNPAALANAARKATERLEFYDKIVAALEAGYMLFPPIDNVDVIAIRSSDGRHDESTRRTPTYQGAPSVEQSADSLPSGEGQYFSPRVHWRYVMTEEVGEPGHETERKVWQAIPGLSRPVFPLVMAKAKCVDAASAAMEQKFFDDIAVFPARAKKDPVILGRIWNGQKGRWFNFLISWRVDKRDL